jgi:hypothetical protein
VITRPGQSLFIYANADECIDLHMKWAERDGREVGGRGGSYTTGLKPPFPEAFSTPTVSNERFDAHVYLKTVFILYCKSSICNAFHVLH